ncbi:MAG: hypothetical protein JXO51_11065 [Candidatus Aminicenantes bacterium]|nr:hypothetical protein [Candidatus Aminicenantes bacterium]
MQFKTLMIIKAFVCLGFGPVLLFLPAWILGLLGTAYGTGAALTAREYGAAMVGILLMTWLARNAAESVARKAIVWNLFVYDAIGLALTLVFLLNGTLNALGWGIAFVYLFFTVGFGYFALRKEKASQ